MMIKTLIFLLGGIAFFYDGAVMAAPKDGEVTLSHDLGFFSKLNKKRRNKTKGPLDCVYGHPVKGKFCPPVMEDPMAQLKEPPKEGGAGTTFEKLTNGIYRLVSLADKEVDDDSSLAVFSRCLDDPDAEGCRELQVGGLSPSSQVAHAPGHLRNLNLATLSPTIDDCGGNMFDPRFCASQMPSTSAAPTEEGDSGDVPSQARVVGTVPPDAGETGAPSTDPATGGPTAGPTTGPSAGPTAGPSAGPTASPTSGGGKVPPGPDQGETGAPSKEPGFVPPGPDGGETGAPSKDPGFVPPGPDGGETGAPSNDPGFVPPGPDGGETGAPSKDPGFVPPGPDGGETGAPSNDPGFVPPGPDGGETTAPSKDPGFVPPGPDGGETTAPSKDPGFVPPGPDGGETGAPSKDPGAVPPGPDGGETTAPSEDPGAVPPGPDGGETTAPSEDPGAVPPGPDGGETTAPSKDPGAVPPGPDGDETATPTADPTMAGTECVSREGTVNLELVQGNCPVDEEPVILASRSNKYAILEVFQAWDDKVDFIAAIFEQGGEPVCASDKDVFRDATHETPLTYTVDCMEGDWAYLELYVKNDGFPSSEVVTIPTLCAERDFVSVSSDKMCKYKIVVSCECNPEAPSSSPSFAPSFSPSMAPSFAPSSAPSAEIETRRIRSSSTEGSYFCSADEFGCDDGPDHVNICHYTSRIGYRTYCVPAADSDLVRFYSTDYCGPCTGGYAVDESGDTA
eukprot:scaffold1428_cov159-Amphora_coffeaeformis.AAC.3